MRHILLYCRSIVYQSSSSTVHIALPCGTQLMLHHLRQRYWIIGSRNLVKAHIRRCVTCAHQAAKASTQLMGNLPESRINPSPPFSHTGVDYAGPFGIIPFVECGQRTRKHYVALFVCLAIKTIHLEIVEDYTTAGFLAAFRRFVSRQGLSAHIYSDNGTNFHGPIASFGPVYRQCVRIQPYKPT